MIRAFLSLGLGFAACSFSAGQEEGKTVEVNLGGVHPAKAFLTVGNDDYLIRVVMVPIQVFDKATNDLLNFEKARELALVALAKYLSKKEAVAFTISGAETQKSGDEGKMYSLTLRVPIKGVTLTKVIEKKATESANATERIVFNSSLFKRKSDYETIIQRLETVLLADLAKVKDEKEEEKLNEALLKINKQGLDNLEKIERAISTDLLLFSTEQEELRQVVAKTRQTFLARIEEIRRNFKEEKPSQQG